MVDDIVVLPSRHSKFMFDTSVSSETMRLRPSPTIPREYGFESPNDDEWVSYGSSVVCPSGEDAYFRFKLIENTRKGLCEYFCLSREPIDFRRPDKSKLVDIYCLWVAVHDMRRQQPPRKYVLWRNVFALTHHETDDCTVDVPVEAAIAEEIRMFAMMNRFPELAAEVQKYPRNTRDVLISELSCPDGIKAYEQLAVNLRAFSETCSFGSGYFYNPYDVFRGVALPQQWSNFEPLSDCQILPFVQFGPVQIGEILHLFSPYYRMHAYQRRAIGSDLEPDTIRHIDAYDKRGIFSIIKYVERIPYSEFELKLTRNLGCNLTLYNQYGVQVKQDLPDGAPTRSLADSIANELNSGSPNWAEAKIIRSWAEEVYITIVNTDRTVEQFFYDLAVASLCTRSLIRDYGGPQFSFGL